jgi:hypothetical protein
MPQDPGMQYLYRQQGATEAKRQPERAQPGRRVDPNTSNQQQEAALSMQHLPRDPIAAASITQVDWSAALGNVHNARLAVEAVQGLVADAVFLDEEAFSSATTLQQYANRLQVCMHAGGTVRMEVDAKPVDCHDALCADLPCGAQYETALPTHRMELESRVHMLPAQQGGLTRKRTPCPALMPAYTQGRQPFKQRNTVCALP